MQECTYFSKKKTSISIDTIIKNEFSAIFKIRYNLRMFMGSSGAVPEWIKKRKKKKIGKAIGDKRSRVGTNRR